MLSKVKKFLFEYIRQVHRIQQCDGGSGGRKDWRLPSLNFS